ncbi:family 78 glycoside hydrolase catalytic domain [Herbiconiux sp. 11R-BC]|uniref:alpha-L-rhamnosidase n=1 Tax=Herbiconiux sp. 11R-BC TaxID=3111637 RepID=UPI003BFEC982
MTLAPESITATRLRTNAVIEPRGIGTAHPVFSWQSTDPNRMQQGYRLQVATSPAFDALAWDTGQVESVEQFGIVYDGEPLRPGTDYWWRVTVFGDGGSGGPSAPATFSTGIVTRLTASTWIADPRPYTADEDPVLYFRTEVEIPRGVVRARAFASALGWYHLVVNGVDQTGPALVPRFTPFEHEVEYREYDLANVLEAGRNTLGMVVADGRFRGRLGFLSRRAVYGDELGAFLHIELELDDGSTRTLGTDGDWRVGRGPVLRADPKWGESADLRIADVWAPGDAPAGFHPVRVLPPHPRQLVAEQAAPVTQVDLLTPSRVWRSPAGRQLVDFGQNFNGVARLRLADASGTRVQLTYSELLAPDGELDTRWILSDPKKPWYQRDTVTVGETGDWYQPSFTTHGFRYVEIIGLDHDLGPDDIRGVVLSSELETSGGFHCADERLNRLWKNVEWSIRSNFTDVPTDCPTRERSGWTGDTQAFLPTAVGFVDVEAYLRRYARSLALEQMPDGRVPPFIPSESTAQTSPGLRRLMRMLANSSGWGDAAVTIPWALYQYYGSIAVLEDQYDSMTRWVDFVARRARTKKGLPRRFSRHRVGAQEAFIVDYGFQWGEWLRPGASGVVERRTDGSLRGAPVTTAYLAESARILGLTAGLLGKTQDAARYALLAQNVRSAWQAAFLRPDGTIGSDRQDEYVRALAFGLVPEEARPGVIARLVELIEAADHHLGTGFLSTPMLLPVLTEIGRSDLAYRILLQTSNPSWLHQVEQGATTIWETWEGFDGDGRGQHSHNHFTFGSVALWMREYLLGIAPTAPGYRTFRVDPTPGGGVDPVEGWVLTPFGRIEVAWRTVGDAIRLEVTVPAGTTATIGHGPSAFEAAPGTHEFTLPMRPVRVGA